MANKTSRNIHQVSDTMLEKMHIHLCISEIRDFRPILANKKSYLSSIGPVEGFKAEPDYVALMLEHGADIEWRRDRADLIVGLAVQLQSRRPRLTDIKQLLDSTAPHHRM